MKKIFLLPVVAAILFNACSPKETKDQDKTKNTVIVSDKDFKYEADKFADIRVLRYRIPGFESLTLKQKEMLYYLTQAGLAGRDIAWDQNYKYNLTIRRILEAVFNSNAGQKDTANWNKFVVYAKQVWFSNGIHHHYSNDKIQPEFSKGYFEETIHALDSTAVPLNSGETVNAFIARLTPIIFDPKIAPKKVNLDSSKDLVQTSATNFYEGVTQKEVDQYYGKLANKADKTPPSHGLNTKVIKENGKVVEKVWKVGGMYSQAIEKIVYWLEKALPLSENDAQKDALAKLISYYKTGDLKTFDAYNIAWVKDTNSVIDVVNGFIEVYGDPLGRKGSFESVVSVKDMEATKRIKAIGQEAQWFEDHSPIMDDHKKKNVTGISAKVITVVSESGDASPSTPIGINLPNAEWIREMHGSKSVNLGNIVDAYDKAKGEGFLKEFSYTEEEMKRTKEHASYADKLHTDMHEVIGHASGQTNKGVGPSHETLKSYASTLEEGRADLVALYYLMDPKLMEIGVMKTMETGKAAYDDYITNGLFFQLNRLKLGDKLEEAHMRNRQLIAKWAYEKGLSEKVIEKKVKDGKSYFVINDYEKLRTLFGQLLREIQRIKSEGDYKAGRDLVENYGVKVDPALHKEMLDRYAKLGIPPYQGFINPKLVPVMDGEKIVDVKVEYPESFSEQMLEYGREYSFLPTLN